MSRVRLSLLSVARASPLAVSPRLFTAAAAPRFAAPRLSSFLRPAAPIARRFHTTPHRADNMKCILIKDGKGPADNLYFGEEPIPVPEKGQVLVKVKTFGLNRMDIVQREGKYPLPPQASKTILGVEFAGTVEKLGEGASMYKVGDEVFGLAYGGAYAEYIACAETMMLPKPKDLSWVQAGGIPENWLTAWQALFLEGGMSKGSNVLIHAGASGVGIAAIQLALQVGEANKVFTTCGTDDKVKFLQKLGGDSGKVTAINYKTQDFAKEIKDSGEGVDLVIDFVGKNYWTQNLNVLNRDGTVVYLAFLSGASLDAGCSLAPILGKRLTIKGSTLRSRTLEYQGKLLDDFKTHALPAIRDGKMLVEIHEVFPWTEVVKAHKEMQANKNTGKIVFEIN